MQLDPWRRFLAHLLPQDLDQRHPLIRLLHPQFVVDLVVFAVAANDVDDDDVVVVDALKIHMPIQACLTVCVWEQAYGPTSR